MTLRRRELRSQHGGTGHWWLGSKDYAIPTNQFGSGDELEPTFHMEHAMIEVQCMCGHHFIQVKEEEFHSSKFDGAECGAGCRARFERYGIAQRGRVGRPPKARS